MKIKISTVSAVMALLVSLIIGIIIGNEFVNLLLKALFFGVLFFSLSFGSLEFIKRKVPELYALLDSGDQVYAGEGAAEMGPGEGEPDSASETDSAAEDFKGQEGREFVDSNISEPVVAPSKLTELGSHILIRDKKIINEPKLMAEAIKTMMAKDSE